MMTLRSPLKLTEAPDAPPLRSFAAWMRKNPLSLKDAPSPEWEATRNALENN